MALREFALGPTGGLRRASAVDLPILVVVAGPNWAGKSTLLYQLYAERQRLMEPGTKVTYLGPHRGWRKTQLGGAALGEVQQGLRAYLEQPAIPGWKAFQPTGLQGVQQGVVRDPGALEEAFSFVKASILKLDQRQQVRLREVWERQGKRIEPDDVPRFLDPLSALVRSLLPHLELTTIDSASDENLRVVFRRVDGQEDDLVEIDDLSSGEKSVIGLMLPLVEAELDVMLGEDTAEEPVPTFIIDEPETHLHPTLQVLLVEHLGELAAHGRLQSIIASQSPTIVDALDDESLFVMAPVAAVSGGNQLVPIGRGKSKLEAMRSLTGSTHLLTRCRPIVFLEGERPPARPISDQKLVEILLPEAKGWVLVAAGGRGSAVTAALQLREAAMEALPGVPVFALVDRDQAMNVDDEHVLSWPVAMVENLLLDSAAIWAVLEPHAEDVALDGSGDVDAALRALAAGMEADEVRLRVAALQRPISCRLNARSRDEVSDAIDAARTQLSSVLDELASDDRVDRQFELAEDTVRTILAEGRELEAFRGKAILEAFYEQYAKRAHPGYKAFAYAIAREARNGTRLRELVAEPVRRLERFVPNRLIEVLSAIERESDEGAERERVSSLLGLVRHAREAWDLDGNVEANFEELRAEAAAIASLLPEGADRALELTAASALLGVRSSTTPAS